MAQQLKPARLRDFLKTNNGKNETWKIGVEISKTFVKYELNGWYNPLVGEINYAESL